VKALSREVDGDETKTFPNPPEFPLLPFLMSNVSVLLELDFLEFYNEPSRLDHEPSPCSHILMDTQRGFSLCPGIPSEPL